MKHRLFTGSLMLSTFLVLSLGILKEVWPTTATAAATYCGTNHDYDSGGGINIHSYIDAYGDPACSGSRYAGYDFYGFSSVNVDFIFVDFMRTWTCGNLDYDFEDHVYNGAAGVNRWAGWSPYSNTCGFQADEQIRFYKSGVVDIWTYVNW